MAPFRPPSPATDPLRLWPVLGAFGIVFSAMIVVGLVIVVVAIVQRGAAPSVSELEALVMAPWPLVVSAAASCSVIGGAALVAARLSPVPLRDRLRLGAGRIDLVPAVGLGAVATLGGLAVGQAFESITAMTGVSVRSSLHLLAEATAAMPLGPFVLLLVIGSFGAGVGEELFFRGYMQTRLVRCWGRWWGIGATAALFGLLHLDVLHTPAALLIGLYLGWLAELRGSILLPIAVHIINNLVSFTLMRLVGDVHLSNGTHALLLVASLVILAAAVMVLRRHGVSEPT